MKEIATEEEEEEYYSLFILILLPKITCSIASSETSKSLRQE